MSNEALMVAVVFGDEPLQEESESKPCCDVRGEAWPRHGQTGATIRTNVSVSGDRLGALNEFLLRRKRY